LQRGVRVRSFRRGSRRLAGQGQVPPASRTVKRPDGVRTNTRLHPPPAVCRLRPRVARERARLTARLTVDDKVAVYCPDCDEREFGESE
jgi:hypothetical protein